MTNKNKIFWQDHNNKQLLEWQQKIDTVSNSNTFCVLPWIHFATRPNGDMRLCCSANASDPIGDQTIGIIKDSNGVPANFANQTPFSAWNTDYMKDVRTTMINGEIPKSCYRCFKEEAKGFSSKRVWETNYWMSEGIDIPELISQTSSDGVVPEKFVYLDLRLGNTCNLKCVMCSPHDSSKWTVENQKMYPLYQDETLKKYLYFEPKSFNNHWHENPDFWKDLYSQIPNIQQLYFAGGEPLAIKEHKLFLEEIVRRGYSDKILVRYNTNGLLIDDDIIELWSHFKKVKVGFSLDGTEDRNWYIRYPSDWNTVEKNLRILDETKDNIEISLVPALQIFNIKHFPDFVKWKINSKFKKINLSKAAPGMFGDNIGEYGGGIFNFHILHIPPWLGPKVLPHDDKLEVMERFKELKSWLYENYRQDDQFWTINPYAWPRYEALLELMNSEDHSHLLPSFKEYVHRLDTLRKLDSKKIFPELAHLL